MSSPDPEYIIAIGASAGGMEEIHNFFDNTPLDGVAYVIIQHLSADFKSRMAELLDKHSKLKVKEAEEGMKVEKNMVYLIPSKKFMTIENGKLKLTEKGEQRGPHLTINTFFNSFANDQGSKAIGVILSGMGSDGTEGVKAIKQHGGMVIARNPDKAEFSSMPTHAIATGMVDFILEPGLMPQTIANYVNNEIKGVATPDDDTNMLAIVKLVKEHHPIDFSDYKPSTLLRRTLRRAASNNFNNLVSYLAFLKNTPAEIELLANDFLISVSSFFRDKEAFELIEKNIIPKMLKQAQPTQEIKLWVAGCATGEEAYSLAILLCEKLTGEFKGTVVKIFATDVDDAALLYAGKGVYNETITTSISPQRIERFFIKEAGNYRVKPEIRHMLIFAHHDVVKNPPYCNMDFISCRNMLIYMNPVLQSKILNMLLFGLKKNGYLFLGPSENPLSIMQSLEVVNGKWKLYRSNEARQAIRFDAFFQPAFSNSKSTPTPQLKEGQVINKRSSLAESINAALMIEFGYTLICVDENNHVVQTFGDTTKYLLQKNFTVNLSELLPKPLDVAFASASRKALQENKKVVVNGIKIESQPAAVSLHVKPLQLFQPDKKMLILIFSDDATTAGLQTGGEVFNKNTYLEEYALNTQAEMMELKNKLQTTQEMLNGSNENMQSFNEELLSANEEMQSTNEEMQSINEELHTLNIDYQAKNKELVDINDDLNNYFRSNVNGQLFVNRDLLLMRFSPGTVKHINLLESDIGRPISNISTNIKLETIKSDIDEVIKTGGIITKEVEANNGKWYQVMTMPYIRLTDSKTDGAIITFNDITELKKIQSQLDKTNKNLRRINADLDNFVLTASHDLLGPLSNIEVTIGLLNQTRKISPELIEYIDIIDNSVKKFRSLIKELAIIGKIESDHVNTEAVDIAKLTDEIRTSISETILSTNAVITTNFEVVHIQFSKKNLRSILFNLISNSLKYRSEKRIPGINISTTTQDDYTVLSVEDNGTGMLQKNLGKIFNLYNQLQYQQGGQGIGLYLVKKIMDANNGKVEVQSTPDVGTLFKIFFKNENIFAKPSLQKVLL